MTQAGFVIGIEQDLIGAVISGGDQRAALARIAPDQFAEPVLMLSRRHGRRSAPHQTCPKPKHCLNGKT